MPRKIGQKPAEIVAAEERAEAKRLRKEAAEAEAERDRERAAQLASEKLLEHQAEFAARQFEQQKALLEVQARLGEKAAQAHREEQSIIRKRDKAIASVPTFRDGDDVEEFLMTAERRLKAGEIPEEEWLTMLEPWLESCRRMQPNNYNYLIYVIITIIIIVTSVIVRCKLSSHS